MMDRTPELLSTVRPRMRKGMNNLQLYLDAQPHVQSENEMKWWPSEPEIQAASNCSQEADINELKDESQSSQSISRVHTGTSVCVDNDSKY
jgi:hypothetical protein